MSSFEDLPLEIYDEVCPNQPPRTPLYANDAQDLLPHRSSDLEP